jgi:hypothetical protein
LFCKSEFYHHECKKKWRLVTTCLFLSPSSFRFLFVSVLFYSVLFCSVLERKWKTRPTEWHIPVNAPLFASSLYCLDSTFWKIVQSLHIVHSLVTLTVHQDKALTTTATDNWDNKMDEK